MRFRSPGRVNLIGGHVDYHDGVVVSMAIDRHVDATVDRRDDGLVVLSSSAIEGEVRVAVDDLPEAASVTPRWGRLAVGVMESMQDLGVDLTPFDATLTSDLPIGGGLSSSAAVGVLLATIVADLADCRLDPIDAVRVVQRAEERATGVPCGVQDPMTAVTGGIVRLDCRDLAVESIALPDGIAVLVVDSGVARTLEGSPWVARRATTFEVAQRLGLDVLRDATSEQVAADPPARHVVSEIDRATRFADLLAAGGVVEAGQLMFASHASSRDDFGSSIPELDSLVEELTGAGAHGARLTGGGHGGCVVALIDDREAERIGATVLERYRGRFGPGRDRPATALVVGPAPGAGRLD